MRMKDNARRSISHAPPGAQGADHLRYARWMLALRGCALRPHPPPPGLPRSADRQYNIEARSIIPHHEQGDHQPEGDGDEHEEARRTWRRWALPPDLVDVVVQPRVAPHVSAQRSEESRRTRRARARAPGRRRTRSPRQREPGRSRHGRLDAAIEEDHVDERDGEQAGEGGHSRRRCAGGAASAASARRDRGRAPRRAQAVRGSRAGSAACPGGRRGS